MFKVNQTKINPSTIELLLTGFVFYLVRQINNVFAYRRCILTSLLAWHFREKLTLIAQFKSLLKEIENRGKKLNFSFDCYSNVNIFHQQLIFYVSIQHLCLILLFYSYYSKIIIYTCNKDLKYEDLMFVLLCKSFKIVNDHFLFRGPPFIFHFQPWSCLPKYD